MSYYRRGTVFLAMGRFKSALSDLERVLELKPDFVSVIYFLYLKFLIFFKQQDNHLKSFFLGKITTCKRFTQTRCI